MHPTHVDYIVYMDLVAGISVWRVMNWWSSCARRYKSSLLASKQALANLDARMLHMCYVICEHQNDSDGMDTWFHFHHDYFIYYKRWNELLNVKITLPMQGRDNFIFSEAPPTSKVRMYTIHELFFDTTLNFWMPWRFSIRPLSLYGPIWADRDVITRLRNLSLDYCGQTTIHVGCMVFLHKYWFYYKNNDLPLW